MSTSYITQQAKILIESMFGPYKKCNCNSLTLVLYCIEDAESYLDFNYDPKTRPWYEEIEPGYTFYKNFTGYRKIMGVGGSGEVHFELSSEELNTQIAHFLIDQDFKIKFLKTSSIKKHIRNKVFMDGFMSFTYGAFIQKKQDIAYGFSFQHCAISNKDVEKFENEYGENLYVHPCNIIMGTIDLYEKI